VSLAPELVEVNAAYNFMPVESLSIICAALKVAKGNDFKLLVIFEWISFL
jgi:hypothetical protein